MVMVAGFVDFLIRNSTLEEKYREDAIYGMTLAVEKAIVCMAVCIFHFCWGNSGKEQYLLSAFWRCVRRLGDFMRIHFWAVSQARLLRLC